MLLQRWSISSKLIAAMPDSERALFFLLGHAINEINVFNKLFYLSNQYDQSKKWEQHAHVTLGMALARALVGKLLEAWNLLGTAYFASKLSLTYGSKLDANAQSALKELGRYFGRENLINKVRNSFAFHYEVKDVRAVLSSELNADELVSYMGETNANTVHYFSEYAINYAMLGSISADPADAMSRLMAESQKVVGWFNDAAQAIMFTLAETYLLAEDGTISTNEVEIGQVPVAEDLEIPFFIESRLAKRVPSA